MEAYRIDQNTDAVVMRSGGFYIGVRFVWTGVSWGRHSTQTVPMSWQWLMQPQYHRLPDDKYMSLDEHYETTAVGNNCKVMDCLREEAYGACKILENINPEEFDSPEEKMDEVDKKYHFIFDSQGHLYWPEL